LEILSPTEQKGGYPDFRTDKMYQSWEILSPLFFLADVAAGGVTLVGVATGSEGRQTVAAGAVTTGWI